MRPGFEHVLFFRSDEEYREGARSAVSTDNGPDFRDNHVFDIPFLAKHRFQIQRILQAVAVTDADDLLRGIYCEPLYRIRKGFYRAPASSRLAAGNQLSLFAGVKNRLNHKKRAYNRGCGAESAAPFQEEEIVHGKPRTELIGRLLRIRSNLLCRCALGFFSAAK